MMKSIFNMQINFKGFYKLMLSFWVYIARYAQSTKKNKFAISLQYLKETMMVEVDFSLADKHQRFLQIDILGECGQTCPNYPE